MFGGFDWRNVWGQHNQLEHVAPQEIYFRILFTPVYYTARCAPYYQGFAGWAAAPWTCMVEAGLPQCSNSWAAETASWFVHFMAVFTLLRWSFISYSHQMFALVILFGCWSPQFSETCSFGGEPWAESLPVCAVWVQLVWIIGLHWAHPEDALIFEVCEH